MAALTDGTTVTMERTSNMVPPTPPPPITPAPAQTTQTQVAPVVPSSTPSTPIPPAYNMTTGLLTDYGRSQGLKEVNAPTTTQQTTPTAQTTQTAVDPLQAKVDSTQKLLDTKQAEYDSAVTNFTNTITQIQNGSIPLSAGEQAQVDALKQSYEVAIGQQKLLNTGASGTANIRGYQTGAAEYDPTFQAKTIGSIMSAGIQKVLALQVEEAAAVAKLTQSLKDNDISKVKMSYDAYTSAADKRQTALQKTIDDTNTAIANAAKAKQEAEKEHYEQVTKPIQEIAKLASQNGAPSSVVNGILNSGNVSTAYGAAGAYSAGGTGMVGEYNFYKAQALASGQTPVDFNTYQNMDANRKAKAAAVANGTAGLTPTQANLATKLSDDYEQRSTDYYKLRSGYNQVLSSASDPSAAGDISLLYGYMKMLDPNSVVRETEFATAQNAGSIPEVIRAKYNQAINGQKLTDTQRADFVGQANKVFNSAKKQQDEVVTEFKSRASKYGVPADLVVRSTSSTSVTDKLLDEGAQAKAKVDAHVKAHPEDAEKVAKLYETASPVFGGGLPSDEQIAEYLNL